MTCPNNVCGTGIVPGPKPGDPDNNLAISATQSYGGIDVSWTYPSTNPHAVAHVLLYRSTSHLVETAIQIAVVAGNLFYDKIAEVGTYFYWIKVVSVNGTVGNFVGPASATTRARSQDTVEDITGQIDRGVLATTLKQDIEDITLNKEELLDAIKDLVAGNDALSGAMDDLQNGLTQAVSFVNTEITERQEGQNALAQQITVVAAANANNAALIVNERTARVSAIDAVARSVDSLRVATGENAAAILSESNARTTQYSALATKTDTVQSTLSNQIASVRTEAETVITQMDGRIQAIGARWTAQLSVNGLVGGFGVYNDGRFVEAGFDVDRFWVGRTNANKRKPFIIENDQTYIDSAVIRNGSIGTLTVAKGAVTSMGYGSGGAGTINSGQMVPVASVYLEMPSESSGVVLMGYGALYGALGDCSGGLMLLKNGNLLAYIGVFVPGGTWFTYNISGFDSNPTGNNLYQLVFASPPDGPGSNKPINHRGAAITATGGKR